MFNKLKNKISEEVKPFSLPTSVQQLTQAVTSTVLNTSNESGNNLVAVNDDSERNSVQSSTFQDDGEFTTIDLRSSTPVRTRKLSSSSVTSELFPIYESSYLKSGSQYDFESASEFDDTSSVQFEYVTKENLYNSYRKMQQKYNKYRGRYVDLLKFYKELEHDNNKTKKLLSETQDKAIQRITELKEQCTLEQKAKAHLEESLRADLEERDHLISTLNDKIGWLKNSDNNCNIDESNQGVVKKNSKVNEAIQPLVDLSENVNNSIDDKINKDYTENNALKEKVKHFESLLSKAKEALTLKNKKIQELTTQLTILERKYEENASSLKTKLESADQRIVQLQQCVDETKKREEESALSLAENKLTIHKELEEKELQIKTLNDSILQIRKENENLVCKINALDTINQHRQDDTESIDISPPVQNSLLRIDEESKFLSDDMKLRIANIKVDFLKYLNIKDFNHFRQYDSEVSSSNRVGDTINNDNFSIVNETLSKLKNELRKNDNCKEDIGKYLTRLEEYIGRIASNYDEKLKAADEIIQLRHFVVDNASQTYDDNNDDHDDDVDEEDMKKNSKRNLEISPEEYNSGNNNNNNSDIIAVEQTKVTKTDNAEDIRNSPTTTLLENYEKRITELRRELEEKHKMLLEERDLDYAKKSKYLERKIDNLINDNRKKTELIESSRNSRIYLDATVRNSKRIVDNLKNENNVLRTSCRSNLNDLSQNAKIFDHLFTKLLTFLRDNNKDEQAKLNDRIVRLKCQNDETNERYEQLLRSEREKNSRLRNYYDLLVRTTNEANDTIARLKSELNEMSDSDKKLEIKIDKCDRLENYVRRLNEKFSDTAYYHRETINSCRRDLNNLSKYVIDYKTLIDDSLNRIDVRRKEDFEIRRKTELSTENDLERQLQQVVYNFESELANKNEEYQRLKDELYAKDEKMENEVYQELNRLIKTTQDDLQLKNDAFEKLLEEFERYKQKTESEKDEMMNNYQNQLQETDKKWRQFLDKKILQMENKNKEEIAELSKEWKTERRQLENSIGNSACDLSTIESLEKRILTLSQELYETKKIHKKEINDLQRLLKIPRENQILENEVSLDDCTELEYLRNVLYEYMMGKEPVVLAKVLAAIVKFDSDQTKTILENEEQKISLLKHITSNIGF